MIIEQQISILEWFEGLCDTEDWRVNSALEHR